MGAENPYYTLQTYLLIHCSNLFFEHMPGISEGSKMASSTTKSDPETQNLKLVEWICGGLNLKLYPKIFCSKACISPACSWEKIWKEILPSNSHTYLDMYVLSAIYLPWAFGFVGQCCTHLCYIVCKGLHFRLLIVT